jgi:F-type H+-transporting ATPase subunit epsilon
MRLNIISPEKPLFEGDVDLVQFPGTEGSFEVLPGHSQMIATLASGDIRIVNHDQTTLKITIRGGVLEVKENVLLVLAS